MLCGVGLVHGDNLSVDGSSVEANAHKGSRIPREQLAEAAQVNQIPVHAIACQLWGEALGFIFHAPVPNVGQTSKSAYRTRAESETGDFPGRSRRPRYSDSDLMR